MKKRKFICGLLILTLILLSFGCNKPSSETESESGDNQTPSSASTLSFVENPADMFTDRDYEVGYRESESALIQLNGDSATCTSDSVQISENIITITDEGTYILSGTLNNGMIIVNADETDKPQLVLDHVSLNSETSAPIYILEADKVFITLAADSINTLSNGGAYTAIDESNIDSVIFSKQDLTLNGSGSLTIQSPAGHGIVSKDDLVLTSGTYSIQSASHGLVGKDSVRIVNANITVASGKDGIHAENAEDASLGFVYIASGTFTIQAEGDGLSSAAYLQIDDGMFDIISGGGSANATKKSSDSWGSFKGGNHGPGGHINPNSGFSSDPDTVSSTSDQEDNSTSIKGIKAATGLLIHNGTFAIDAADDGIHSNAALAIYGGTFEIATGDDGLHADEALSIFSGEINITESYEGLEGLSIAIYGGNITLLASDDGLNAAGGNDESGFAGPRGNDMFASDSDSFITISGGSLYVNASGDGIDSNGSLQVSGGHTVVVGPTDGGNGPLDYGSNASISAGTFIVTGSAQMAQSITSSSTQGVIAVTTGSQSAGTIVKLTDENGNVIISQKPEKSFACVIVSCPEIIRGKSYTLTVGSSSAEFTAN